MASHRHNDDVITITLDLSLESFHTDPTTMHLFRHAAFEHDPSSSSSSIFGDAIGGPGGFAALPPPWLSPIFIVRPVLDPLTPSFDSAAAACEAIKTLPERLEGIAKEMRRNIDMVEKFAAGHPARADFAKIMTAKGGTSTNANTNANGHGNDHGQAHINDSASVISHVTTAVMAGGGDGGGGGGGGAKSSSNNGPPVISRIQFQALMTRVEELEHEVSRLRGRADTQQHRINGIEGGLRGLSRFGNRNGGQGQGK